MSIFVIAEIGINHNGDLNLCKKLIKEAKECGCDAVKFQKRTIKNLAIKEVLNAKDERFPIFGNTEIDMVYNNKSKSLEVAQLP